MTGRALHLALLSAYAVLWLGGLATCCRPAPPVQPSWGATGFLLCGAALVWLNAPGARAWLLLVGCGGWLAELVGSRFGVPFGPYSYTGALQPQLAGVPLVMSCAWIVLVAYVKSLEPALRAPAALRVFAGAAWMAVIDLAIEPVATHMLAYWRWHAPGVYHGVPWSNFAGWLVVSALLLAAGLRVRLSSGWVRRIGLSVVAFFGALGAAGGIRASAGVALLLLALHAALSRLGGVRAAGTVAKL